MTKDNIKIGRIGNNDIIELINKKAGTKVSFNLSKDPPSSVKYWIPTGSRWLDSIICRGQKGGIPGGRITEIAALEGVGKSYMAAQIAKNAQQLGIKPVYFDSENALDQTFLVNTGCNIEDIVYVQATSVEFVFETIQQLLGASDQKFLFIWDSFANTPSKSDLEGEFDPQSSMAKVPRIATLGMKKLIVPLGNHGSSLLVLNQLKTNIARTPQEAMVKPYFTPGGFALAYAYSLRIWLTKRRAKAAYVYDEKMFKIGSEVKVKLEKSRFGTEGRECVFKILWGTQDVGIQDEESWWEAIQNSSKISKQGHRYVLDGFDKPFFEKDWIEMLKDEKFKEIVFNIMNEEVIERFDKRTGEAKTFYNIDGEEEQRVVSSDAADEDE